MIWKKSNDTLIKLISSPTLGERNRGEIRNININVRVEALNEYMWFCLIKKIIQLRELKRYDQSLTLKVEFFNLFSFL